MNEEVDYQNAQASIVILEQLAFTQREHKKLENEQSSNAKPTRRSTRNASDNH